MPLIKCPECGKEISDKASTCPNCAYPIHAQTIEATGKKWKRNKVLGIVLIVIGVSGIVSGRRDNVIIGICFFIGGLITYSRARFGAWWYHG